MTGCENTNPVLPCDPKDFPQEEPASAAEGKSAKEAEIEALAAEICNPLPPTAKMIAAVAELIATTQELNRLLAKQAQSKKCASSR